MFKKEYSKNLTLLPQIKADFYQGNPVFFDMDVEGQRLTKADDYVLGGSIVNERSVTYLLHEMGHLAEREIPKLLIKRKNWGYSEGFFWQVGRHSGYEMRSDKDVQREKRCFAYQLSLIRHYGIDEGAEDLVGGVDFLGGWSFYVHRHCGQFYGAEADKKAKGILCTEIEELSKTTFNFDQFVKNWQERMTALKHIKKAA